MTGQENRILIHSFNHSVIHAVLVGVLGYKLGKIWSVLSG